MFAGYAAQVVPIIRPERIAVAPDRARAGGRALFGVKGICCAIFTLEIATALEPQLTFVTTARDSRLACRAGKKDRLEDVLGALMR